MSPRRDRIPAPPRLVLAVTPDRRVLLAAVDAGMVWTDTTTGQVILGLVQTHRQVIGARLSELVRAGWVEENPVPVGTGARGWQLTDDGRAALGSQC